MPWGVLRTLACATLIVHAAACSDKPPPLAPAPADAGAAAPQDPGEEAVVTASRGGVELQRGASTAWAPARVGDKLAATDSLRTDLGEADVSLDGVRLRVHESSHLELKRVEKRGLRARVKGSVESDVQKDNRVDMEVEDSDAVAHSQGGHFFVTSDGHGVIAVATVTGSVNLTSGGRSVDVNKGEISRVVEQKTPSQPSAALRRVLLSVEWPGKETNRTRLPITGRVEPGSRVFVQGQPVVVESGGAFRAEVPLKQGKQKIAVVTVDALGRRKQVDGVVLRDDSLPEAKVKKKLWQWR